MADKKKSTPSHAKPLIASVTGLHDLPPEEQEKILRDMIKKVDALFGKRPTSTPTEPPKEDTPSA